MRGEQLTMMQFFTKKHKGFTLIELLVVIAIIGILSSVVLVALGGARKKAKDSAIISDMAQIRTVGEMFYDTNKTYTRLGDSTDVGKLVDDIKAQGGKKPSDGTTTGIDMPIKTDGTAYCAEVLLNAGNYYCIDSTLVGKSYTSNPNCDITAGAEKYTCETP